jgi:hypothetical protein
MSVVKYPSFLAYGHSTAVVIDASAHCATSCPHHVSCALCMRSSVECQALNRQWCGMVTALAGKGSVC